MTCAPSLCKKIARWFWQMRSAAPRHDRGASVEQDEQDCARSLYSAQLSSGFFRFQITASEITDEANR